MSGRSDSPRSIKEQLLRQPRRTVGVGSTGAPARLGERDSSGYLVGYIDAEGLAWQSLTERIVAVEGHRLAEAMALPYDALRGDQLIDRSLANVPDELIGEVAREAAGHLWLKGYGLPNPALRPPLQ
jgi:hypothetical protein